MLRCVTDASAPIKEIFSFIRGVQPWMEEFRFTITDGCLHLLEPDQCVCSYNECTLTVLGSLLGGMKPAKHLSSGGFPTNPTIFIIIIQQDNFTTLSTTD